MSSGAIGAVKSKADTVKTCQKLAGETGEVPGDADGN